MDQGYQGRQITLYSINDGNLIETKIPYDDITVIGKPGKSVQVQNFSCTVRFDPSTYDLVMLFSDGVHTFQHSDTLTPINFLEVVDHLMDIKSFTGEFVTRRCRSFLNRFCVKNGWHHNDDLGVAAIHIPEPEMGDAED